MDDSAFQFGLLCVTSFIAMLNPFVVMPVFMSLTAPLSPAAARKTAIKAVLTASIAATLFAVAGNVIFKMFGISIDSLQVAGGLVILVMGYDMLQANFKRNQSQEELEREFITDFAITPIGIPLLCGPTAITMFILRMQEATTVPMKIAFFTAMVVASLAVLLILILSRQVNRFLGDTGAKIVLRIMGLILMIMAVEFVAAGAKPMIREILNIPVNALPSVQ
jgi:multiple antibiotic resistance protein